MCVVKKYDLELRRKFVSNHCVATLKEAGLVDMCLFSGEGKPTLLGGYVLSGKEAYDLGRGLISTSAFAEGATKEEKKRAVQDSVTNVYQILKGLNDEQAEKLKELFDIKIVEKQEPKTDHGYIG